MITERSEYKGHPLLVLKRTPEDKYPFSFGLSKAQLLVEAKAEIEQFVLEELAKDTKSKPSPVITTNP